MGTAEADPFASWPDRTPLYDGDDLLAVFTVTESTRDGRPWADGVWRPRTSSAERTAAAVLDAMAGWAVSTSDPELANALEASGATELRHAHTMTHSLTDLPPPSVQPPLRIEPLPAARLVRTAEALAELGILAYPSDHPDHETADQSVAVQELTSIAHGEVLGPYLEQSQLALVDDAVVGACLLVERDGVAPDGGPWVVDIFRDPRVTVRGVGRALLSAALLAAAEAGLPSISLVVSSGNASARRLYSALGFLETSESWTLTLPHLP